MGDTDERSARLPTQRYSFAQLLLGTAGVLYGLFASLTLAVIAGLVLGTGGLAKLIAHRVGVSKRTFTALNVGPILLLAGYLAVVAAGAGNWGFAILALTIGGGATAVLLPSHGEGFPEAIGVVGFGALTGYYAVAGDLLVATVGALFVALNAKGLLDRRRADA